MAFCGVTSALALVFMLTAYFPYFTYALPAVAGVLMMLLVIEINQKWALGGYACVSLLSLLLCEKEAAVLFLCFFGIYPILKSNFERIHSRVLELAVKFVFFNLCVIIGYLAIIYIFHISMEEISTFGRYTNLFLLLLGNVVFWIYDLALTRLITGYLHQLHPKVRKILR